MTIRVDLSPELEALLTAEACAKGESLEQIAEQLEDFRRYTDILALHP